MYQDTFHCLPNTNIYHTIILNNIHSNDERSLFCPNYFEDNLTKYERNLNHYCNQMCGNPCHEVFHDVDISFNFPSNDELKIHFYSKDKVYRSIEYVPKMSMMEFLINLFNIWNLWHGTSLITVLVIFTKFLKKLLWFIPFVTNGLNTRIMLKIISMILLILFIEKIISLSIGYLRYDSITKINFLDYEDNTHYPYVSFTLEDRTKYFLINLANFKSNFTLLPKDIYHGYNKVLENHILGQESEIFQEDSFYYSSDSIEFFVNRLNLTKQDLFNQEYFRNYCLNGISIYIYDDNLLTKINEHNLSYSTIVGL